MDLARYRGIGAFGRAYEFMMANDAHAPNSVDRALACAMVRLCSETQGELYGSFTALDIGYEPGTRPGLESVLRQLVPPAGATEEVLSAIARFTRGLGERADQDPNKMQIGGMEEEIIERGSDWCTDVARVACVLCQIAGIPCRIVNLFDLDRAYSGHVIVEAYRAPTWGAVDSSTGVVYHGYEAKPATVWDLMNDAKLVETHPGPGAWYTSVGQFRAAGIANYYCWERDHYDYTVTGLNRYYRSILKMSDQDWLGGLRWLYGEDGRQAEL